MHRRLLATAAVVSLFLTIPRADRASGGDHETASNIQDVCAEIPDLVDEMDDTLQSWPIENVEAPPELEGRLLYYWRLSKLDALWCDGYARTAPSGVVGANVRWDL